MSTSLQPAQTAVATPQTPVAPPVVQTAPTPPPRSPVPSIAFGAADWKRYFGDVGVEPPLPPNIDAILDSPCPIWPGQTIRQTHLLVLIPQTVNGSPFTLDLLEQLIQHPQGGGHATKYGGYNSDTKAQHGSAPAPTSHWVLMTRDVVNGTRNKSYDDQKKVISQYASHGYGPPRALEAATVVLMEHVRTGNRLYNDSPWTFTRCQDLFQYQGKQYPLVVGGFAPGGLDVSDFSWVAYDNFGLAALRNL